MTMTTEFTSSPPERTTLDRWAGPLLVEFGSATCGWCRAAQPLLDNALASHPDVHHVKVADGRRRPLGRSFGVKLWPTLVFMLDGQEIARLVRPGDESLIAEALARIDP